jgi:hypothetical protein
MRLLTFIHTMLIGAFVVYPSRLAAQDTTVSDGGIAVTAADTDGQPISDSERFRWAVHSTIGPKSLGVGVLSAAWRTALNNPEEYGPHWGGYGKRYGVRLVGVATGNIIEAGVGKLWGEDPRYVHSTEGRPLSRVRHAAAMVFIAPRRDGNRGPAYARYTGIVGNNVISNAWRPGSENGLGAALTRSALGFLGKFASNVIGEFWQDIHQKVQRRP